MAITFKTPSQLADDYLRILKSLKPSVNIAQKDTDWWIRSRALGGLVAGVYADQRLIANDAFPQRARTEAVLRFLDLYFQRGFKDATQSVGLAFISGEVGTPVNTGLQFTYSPNGNIYAADESIVMTAPTGFVRVKSAGTGQAQNLFEEAPLTISSPPTGLDSASYAYSDFTDGRNQETNSEAVAAILARIRQPIGVGRESDYIQYAFEASTSVVSASVVRFPFGLGTVGVYITSGTTDIDTALDNGQAITFEPSDELIETVQAYLQANKPVTDCVTVMKPIPKTIDVVAKIRYSNGDGTTILTGQTLTQEQLVVREIQRAIYKTPVGGRVFDAQGYMLASEIEETIDAGLSAGDPVVGSNPILSDRQIISLNLASPNCTVGTNEKPIPGTITVTGF